MALGYNTFMSCLLITNLNVDPPKDQRLAELSNFVSGSNSKKLCASCQLCASHGAYFSRAAQRLFF